MAWVDPETSLQLNKFEPCVLFLAFLRTECPQCDEYLRHVQSFAPGAPAVLALVIVLVFFSSVFTCRRRGRDLHKRKNTNNRHTPTRPSFSAHPSPLSSHEPKWRLRQSEEFIRYPPKRSTGYAHSQPRIVLPASHRRIVGGLCVRNWRGFFFQCKWFIWPPKQVARRRTSQATPPRCGRPTQISWTSPAPRTAPRAAHR